MNGQKNSHVRQHYIPQFILKNFCYDDNKEKLLYFRAGEDEYTSEWVSNVFMERYLYSQETSLEIEESLSKFEAEIAPVFKKICNDSEIILSVAEDERLRVFLSLLTFRSVATRNQFDGMSDFSKALYGQSTPNADMRSVWLENVRQISSCRTIKEILANPGISSLLKLFIQNEFHDFYTCILERRGPIDFAISDCYPTVMNGESELPNGKVINLPVYYFYPISASRVLMLVTNHINVVPRSIAYFDCTKTLKGPKGTLDKTKLIFKPVRVYAPEVEWINEMVVKNAEVGIVVKDIERCSSYI